MRVILRPLNKHKMLNLVKFKNCYDYLVPYYTRSGNIYTGLTSDDAKRLGDMLNINLFPNSGWWSSFNVRIGADDVYFETEDPLDEIRYLFLKNHKRVKSSMFEHKATADYLLINKDEEAKRENIFNKAKVDAIFEFKRMSATDMRKCLRLFGNNAESMSNELVENAMFKIVENNPDMFLSKWVNNKDRELEVVIEQSIARNIIRRNKNIYKYGSEVIGYSMQEVIDFLAAPKNQDIKLSILNAIEAKDYVPTHNMTEESTDQYNTPIEKAKSVKKNKPVIKPTGLIGDDDFAIDISKLDLNE